MAFGPCEEYSKKLDDEIIKLMWTRKVDGQTKQGRRMVARKRVAASYDMGGLKMDFSRETAQGLLLNGLQRVRNQAAYDNDRQNFLYRLLTARLREINLLNITEMFDVGGPRIWRDIGNRLVNKSPFFAQVFASMAELLELNEKTRDGWHTASISGHSESYDLFRISSAEGLILAHYGLNHVGQLFGISDITGQTILTQDTVYPEGLEGRYPELVIKCKNLRVKLRGRPLSTGMVIGNFLQVTAGMKYSGLYRKMVRAELDASMPGPPAFFTRRKDGIPVPALSKFMTGYRNLFKMDMASKTLENSFLLMNRQIWTNQKRSLSTAGQEEMQDSACKLCGRQENTMHLMFECEKYSEPLWETLEMVVGETMRHRAGDNNANRIRMHAFMVLYNINDYLPNAYVKSITVLIQEIKRNIVFRRYKRETGNNAIIRYDRNRLLGHILITVRKLISLRKYQGKNKDIYEDIAEVIQGLIQ
jgi:hypothetical protein